MASLIDLRRRIRSVKNTQQITKAMKMVAAARLRRAQDKILGTRPYALELQKVIRNLADQSAGEAAHPMLVDRPEKKVLLAVVTGDKGLCGSFNSNVLRQADRSLPEFRGKVEALDLLLLGRRGADYYKRRTWSIRESHRSLFTQVKYEDATSIAEDASQAFLDGEYDAVYVIYNRFVSVMTQKLTIEKILPVVAEATSDDKSADAGSSQDYLYEPPAEEILRDLLPRFITFQFYRVLLESQAAEHAARMTAMDAATKNAGELIEKLTLTYNRSRQAAITTELIEVVSGANALAG